MSYSTIEVVIENGRITPKQPEKLPEKGEGLLIVLPQQESPPGTELKAEGQSPNSGETPLRPYGLAKGKFVVPADFNAPLPEEVLREFEEA